ncbi:VIT1/CCC1 transporter family protein [Hyphococcus flavus]|uniref:VIT1/CCC1 transporter family protein n=1 Tax=Hyphococcus flavus TaxID=1866326 RepID=A0AAE9ZBJ7_9PROT|nr:VIT1/CCC1 transporter family protein [Hyphococcus flavus]WDI31066.1 VIT1/CCC1 transporter family protein [Hyphococcus flavus]
MDPDTSTDDIEHGHSPRAIAERLKEGPEINYLRDWVLGGIDGAVTTFAIVAGVAGAALSTKVILILGAANLLADGFSMAAGNYSGVKAEKDEYERLKQMELRHIALTPEGEREEVRQIFAAKGFEGDDLERAVEIITESQERWVRVMLEEEHGAPKVERSAVKSGLITFAAFFICGAVPLVPFLFGGLSNALVVASVMTSAVFFGIGAVKSKWSTARWWWSGLETFAIGMTAAGVAYLVGALLKSWVGV